ncbi:MAG TPA: rhodanese-like domain-containing protein [Vicinamibacterales bacterium]
MGTIAVVAVTCAQLASQLASGKPSLILDVRSEREFVRGRVPGAVHAPFWRLDRLMAAARTRLHGVPIVVYCGHGPRAWWAALRLRRHGVAPVHCLTGHMAGWRRARLREERP